ncbi:MAG: hypothetical protein Tsb002_27900 [Wenzhouxiangellaceae bacterium]
MHNKQTQDSSLTNDIEKLDDDMLQSISGGCTSSCGGLTTQAFSCMPPGVQCP